MFFGGRKTCYVFRMNEQPAKAPIKNLRDAYKVPGFHVRAKLDSHELDGYGVAVLTLDRRSKKACAADAGRHAAGLPSLSPGACPDAPAVPG